MPRQIEPSPRPVPRPLTILALVLAISGAGAAPHSWQSRFELRKLEEPGGVAFGKDGSIYVSESMAHRVSVFDGAGRVTKRFGKFGRAPGNFDRPSGIGVAPDGSVYVADTGNRRIEVFSPEGRLVRAWGRAGIAPGEFLEPIGIAVGGTRVLVADGRAARVQVFDLAGNFLFYVWSHGHKAGQLGRPVAVAVDAAGAFYVSDSDNCRIQKFDANGRPVLGWGDRGRQSGLLSQPGGLAWSRGAVHVADSNNERIQAFDGDGQVLLDWRPPPGRPTQIAISPDGDSLVLCEEQGDLCRVFGAAAAEEASGHAVPGPHLGSTAACSENLLLVSDTSTQALALFDLHESPPRAVGVLATFGFEASEVVRPAGADIDRAQGSVLVSDSGANRLLLFQTGSGDTWENSARFTKSLVFDAEALGPRLADWHLDPQEVQPGAIARAPGGDLFLADLASSRIVVLDRGLRFVRSWGRHGDEDGCFLEPAGLAWSATGPILYVVDSGRRRVQAFDPGGNLLSAWGRRGREEGEFEDPTGIAVGRDGSVYVADRGLRKVQKFAPDGKFLKAWGGTKSRGSALGRPEKIFVDDRGRIVVIDPGKERILLFTPEGKLTESYGPEILAGILGTRPSVPDPPATRVDPDGYSAPILSNDGTYLVRYRTDPSPIPLNEPFSMEVLVYESGDPSRLADAVSVEVGARMRAHRHGMNQVPKVRAVWDDAVPGPLASYVLENPALGNGRYRVRGMLFHMPGTWTLDFDLTRWAITERAQIDLGLD